LRLAIAVAFLTAAFASAADSMATASTAPRPRTGAEIVQNTCILCHGTGASGAPRARNAREWRPRLRAGIDGLVRSAAAGKGAMPVRGGMPDLTDDELRAAIVYLTGLDEAGESN
jgi:cytochrome c5